MSSLNRCSSIADMQESHNKAQWFYLSFASGEFLGGAIVYARGVAHACRVCWDRHINPGGEVLGEPIPKDAVPARKWRNRLLAEADVYEIWPDAVRLRDLSEEERRSVCSARAAVLVDQEIEDLATR